MRTTIRQMLIDNIAEIGGRVYEPQAAGKDTQPPYIVLREGVQDPEADWSDFSTIVEIWPYVKRTTFQQVDTLVNSIINTLHRARFSEGGEEYLADYIGTVGQDFVDTEWDAITRGLRFRVFALGWLNGLTYDPDPVKSLQSWTKDKWPTEVYADPASWSPVDTKPGIYWRLVRINLIEITVAVNWLEAQISCHILAPSASIRLKWIRRVSEELAKQRSLEMEDGGLMQLIKIAADSEADPMRKGQITLTVRFGVLQPTAEYETLNKAAASGDIKMEAIGNG